MRRLLFVALFMLPAAARATSNSGSINAAAGNITGTMTATQFVGGGAGLTGVIASSGTSHVNGSLVGDGTTGAPLGVNSSSVPVLGASGLVQNAQLDSSSVTKQGNAFNNASQLVQMTPGNKLPAVDGSLLTGITAVFNGGTVPLQTIFLSTVNLTGPNGLIVNGPITGNSFFGVSNATETTTAALTGVGTAASPLGVNSSSVAVLSGGFVPNFQIDPSSVNKVIGLSSSCSSGFFFNSAVWVNGVQTGGACTSVTSGEGGISTGVVTSAALTGNGNSTSILSVVSSSVAVLNASSFVQNFQIDPSSVTKQGFVSLSNLTGAVPTGQVNLSTVTTQLNAVALSTTNLAAGSATTYLLVNGNNFMTGQLTTQSTETVQGNAFSVGGSSFTVVGGSATVAYGMTAKSFFGSGANLTGIPSTGSISGFYLPLTGGTLTGQVTNTSTETIQGSAFSVGGSSFSVGGGSATVAYQLIAGSISMSGPSSTITNTSSMTASAFFGDGSHISGLVPVACTTGSNTTDVLCLGANSNSVSSSYSSVGGGFTNSASGAGSTISGGETNTASGGGSTISGGISNTASAIYSTVGGGLSNTAQLPYATVSGGQANTSSGLYATVPGGVINSASGLRSFAAGWDANANSDNTFVWGSTQAAEVDKGIGSFNIGAIGGVFIDSGSLTVQYGMIASTGIFTSTFTVQGSAFSVGGASFTVAGGTVAVAYMLTSANLQVTNEIDFGNVQGSLYQDGLETVLNAGNSLELSVGGNPAIYMDATNGNTSIGNTESPQTTLDVFGAATIRGQETITSTMTIQGNTFSVGGSSFTVSGGNVGSFWMVPGSTISSSGGVLTFSTDTVNTANQSSAIQMDNLGNFRINGNGLYAASISTIVLPVGNMLAANFIVTGSSTSAVGLRTDTALVTNGRVLNWENFSNATSFLGSSFQMNVGSGTLATPQGWSGAIPTGATISQFITALSTGYTPVNLSNIKTILDSVGVSTVAPITLPADITFATTRQGGTTNTEVMRLDSNGRLDLGITTGTARFLETGTAADAAGPSTGAWFHGGGNNSPSNYHTSLGVDYRPTAGSAGILQTGIYIGQAFDPANITQANVNTYIPFFIDHLNNGIHYPFMVNFANQLGIGTASPAAMVHISSNNVSQAGLTPSTSLLIDGNAATSFKIGVSSFIIQSGGNVGIGTSSPATLFHMSSGTLTLDGNSAAFTSSGTMTTGSLTVTGQETIASTLTIQGSGGLAVSTINGYGSGLAISTGTTFISTVTFLRTAAIVTPNVTALSITDSGGAASVAINATCQNSAAGSLTYGGSAGYIFNENSRELALNSISGTRNGIALQARLSDSSASGLYLQPAGGTVYAQGEGGVVVTYGVTAGTATVNGVIVSSTTQGSVSCTAGTGILNRTCTDQHCTFAAGTLATACTYTFGTAWNQIPDCVATTNAATPLVTSVSAVSKTALTITASAALTGDNVTFLCMAAP